MTTHTAARLLSALLSVCAPAMAHAQDLAPPPGYKLVWADEFDVDGLPDPAKWAYDQHANKGGWYNHELQYYAGPRAENAVVKGGRLLITARQETLSGAPDWGGQRYTSTRLFTRGKADWTYGYFEIRAKLPCGKGTWPAIWMLGSQGAWPAGGELDILEQLGHDPARVFSTVHVAAGHGGNTVGGAQKLTDACSAFHTYQMHWTPQGIHFGVDGFTHLHYPKLDLPPPHGARAWPFDAPQYLLLNMAIGGDLGGTVDDKIFPVTMEVDYVRVWQAVK
jgi:beta-glucanase (GH16 family)